MLLRLEVENFKSYHGYQTLGPFLQFTAVIGPNGAGKSNLMDAISFVLGVRAQQLRAEKAKTLINGYETSHAAKKAYVRAVYKAEEDENELHFYRSVNAKGESEYKINDRTVSQEQYIKKLESIHILSKARNFLVFQGDVENIAGMDPKALTKLFEQISGSGALQKEYEALQARKDAAEEELKDFHSRRKGIMAEKKQFKEQQAEAERFQELAGKRAKYAHDHHLYQLYTIEHTLAELAASMAELQAEEERHEARVSQIEKQAAAKRKDHAKEAKALVKLEDDVKRRQNEIRALKPKQIKLEEQIRHAQDKLKEAKAELSRASQRHDKKAENIEGLEAELEKTQRRLKEHEQRAREARGKGVQLADAQLEEYSALKKQAAAETAEKQAALDHAARARDNVRDQLHRLEIQAHTTSVAVAQAAEQIAKLAEREKKLEEQLRTYAGRVAEEQAKVDTLERQKADDDAREKALREELARVQTQLSEAKADKQESERERKAAETYEALKGLFPGVKGRLLDLCDVTHKRYNTAVTVVMGKNMSAIVVDKEETARACINYMKEQKAGTATFLPLQTIHAKPIDERLRSLGGTKKPVADVLRFPREIQAAVEYACGNAVVCDTLEEARQLCFSGAGGQRYKCVTLDGTLIRKSGVMTGGAGLEGQASKWDSRAVDELRRQRARCQKELDDLVKRKGPRDREISDNTSQIRGVQIKMRSMETDLGVTRDKLKDKRLTVTGHEAELARIDVDGVTAQLAAAQAQVDALEAARNKVVDKHFAAFCKRVGISNIREYEGKDLREAQERQRERVELQSQEDKIKSQIKYHQARDTQADVDKAKAEVRTQQGQLAELETSLAAVRGDVEAGSAHVDELRDKAAQAAQLVEEKNLEVTTLKDALKQQQAELADVRKKLGMHGVDADKQRGRRHSLLQACRFDKIDLALVGGGSLLDLDWEGDAGPAPLADSLATQERDAVHAREEAIKIDFTKLKQDLRDATDPADVQAVNEQFENKLKEIEAQMESMAPNMKASDKLDTVREKLGKVGAEFTAAQARAQDADKAFREIQRQRYELFNKAFEHVSRVIDPIYKELTKNPNLGATAVGGTAYLTLENAEEPYLHGVKYNTMPPSKRFRDMEQLSGGEKTVAALALLFAIHDYRPSPFFVLDEIDAALDKTNVQKVANYIQNSSKKFQCIVISLKDSFYSKADGIVGIYRDQAHQSSRSLTLDLRPFDNHSNNAIPAR